MENVGKIRIAVIRGDGIGVEVIEEGLKVLQAVDNRVGIGLEFTEFPWGSGHYFEQGTMLPASALDTLSAYDALYLGAVGHPEIHDHITLNELLLPIRREFDQYVCLRPNTLFPGIESPLKGSNPWGIDMMIVRENTEGEYANVGGIQFKDQCTEMGVQTGVFTRRGCERVIRYAFDLARKRDGKKQVTSITKSNAQGYGMVVWDRAFERAADDYPDIVTRSLLVDAAAMEFVRRPEAFDLVVASNLFGDILSDMAAVITGSIGLAASGNINPDGEQPSMFEPVHGSAPDIAGKGVANPLAAILSAAMMLEHLGQAVEAEAIQKAVLLVIERREMLSSDMGGTATTQQVGDAVLSALGSV